MKIKNDIIANIKKGDSYFESNYFNEALFEYETAISLTQQIKNTDFSEEIKKHIVDIFEKKAYCFDELNLYNEAVETYLHIIDFLDENFDKEFKDDFLNKNYSNISENILELFIEADVFENKFNYREAFDRRLICLKLVNNLAVHVGDLLSFKSPYELLKQAKLAKFLSNYPQAKKYYNIAIDIATDYSFSDIEFFTPYTETVFKESILFYEEINDSKEIITLIDKFIFFIEKRFNTGEIINYSLTGDFYVKKALLTDDVSKKHHFFNKAMEFYKYVDAHSIKNPFYYYIAYVETKLYILIEPQELMETLEKLTEYFLCKSIKNYGTFYYLKTLKILLLVYFDKKKLLKIIEIERNLQINENILNPEELVIFINIKEFLKGCRALLDFQKNIYEDDNDDIDNHNSMIAHKYFERLWDASFISNEQYASFLYTLTRLYRDTIKNTTNAFFYLKIIPKLYNEEFNSESYNIIFSFSFYELSLYHQEKAEFQDSLSYISKSIQLFKELFAISPLTYAIHLHDALINRAVMCYNYFSDYESFEHSIKEGIEVLEANIQNSTELAKLLKTLSLKASIDYNTDKKEEALETYKKAYNLCKFYLFKNSGNLDRIFNEIIDVGIQLAIELGNKEVEENFRKRKQSIKLFSI